MSNYLTHENPQSFDSPHVITDYVFYVKSMVDHIMKETGVSSVSLVGHSMGSSVGCLFASVYPEMVEDLVMIEGLGPMSRCVRAYVCMCMGARAYVCVGGTNSDEKQ